MGLIVIIEDNAASAKLVKTLLTRSNHDVIIAPDGETGLKDVFESQPDLIIIDLGLPDIDGQTVIGLIRQQPHLATTPIVAFTGWPDEEAQEMAASYGCDGIISKPIDARTFAGQIEAFLIKNSG